MVYNFSQIGKLMQLIAVVLTPEERVDLVKALKCYVDHRAFPHEIARTQNLATRIQLLPTVNVPAAVVNTPVKES